MTQSDRTDDATSEVQSPATDQPLKGINLLLAEDCVDQSRMFLYCATSAGADVTLECNGQAAVDAVRRNPQHFDVIVMDFQMPEMDGLDATRQLRELGFQGTILAATAFGCEALREAWFLAGCDDYLEKPLTKRELVEAVLRHATAPAQR